MQASLFSSDVPPVVQPLPALKRIAGYVVGRLLAFWDSPGVDATRTTETAPGRAVAPAGDVVLGKDSAPCHSAISRRTSRGGAVGTVSLARGGRLLKLRMSRKKNLQEVKVEGGTENFGTDDRVQQVKLGTWDDRERIGESCKRGTISSFSWRSRNRLLDLVNSINQSEAPSSRWRFITPTYHNQDVTPRESKAHLQALLKCMDRCFGRVGVLWKVEPQKRGMPHYHLLALMPASHVADLETEREWFATTWVRITSGTPEQHRVHCRPEAWQQMEDWEHVAGYAGKYVGKVVNVPNESAWAKAGRWWGKVNADMLPIKVESCVFTEQESYCIQRLMRKAAKAKARQAGFTLHLNGEKLKMGWGTWASRKECRRAGLKVTRIKPWIRSGLGGRLYMLESESLRLLAFGQGMRVAWGIGDTPSNVVLGFNDDRESKGIPF